MVLLLLLSQCSCNPIDEMSAISRSHLVFEGVVDSVVVDSPFVKYMFRVSFVIKGNAGDTLTIFSPYGMCDARFVEGAEYRVFAISRGDSLFSDRCSGSYRIYVEEEYEE